MPAPRKIHTIVTHVRPHLDEIVAIWLLQRFGRQSFDIPRDVKFEYWDAGSYPPDGRKAEEWENDGYLLIGVGHGQFDEHPSETTDRVEGHSSTSLVAQAIKVEKRSDVRRIVEYVTKNDLEGGTSPWELPAIIGNMHAQYPDDTARVMRWVHQGLNAQHAQAVQFKAALGVVNAARIESFGDKVDQAKFLIVNSNNERVLPAAWTSQHRPQAVIITHNNGQVQIFANKRFGLRLNALAAAVRIAEAAKHGITLDLSTEMLEREGSVVGAEAWHYFLAGEMLFNGSLTAPRTEATLLSIEELIELFKQHVQAPSPSEEIPAT